MTKKPLVVPVKQERTKIPMEEEHSHHFFLPSLLLTRSSLFSPTTTRFINKTQTSLQKQA